MTNSFLNLHANNLLGIPNVNFAEKANQEGVLEPENNQHADANIAEKANERVDFQEILESNPQDQIATVNFPDRYDVQVYIQANKDETNL